MSGTCHSTIGSTGLWHWTLEKIQSVWNMSCKDWIHWSLALILKRNSVYHRDVSFEVLKIMLVWANKIICAFHFLWMKHQTIFTKFALKNNFSFPFFAPPYSTFRLNPDSDRSDFQLHHPKLPPPKGLEPTTSCLLDARPTPLGQAVVNEITVLNFFI